ncbi:hypothetical protein STANM309S_03190 [Streptomyces tanashiensis]
MPVGMFRPAMSASEMPSRCLTRARRLLPWAATRTVRQAARDDAVVPVREHADDDLLRHSVRGRSSGGIVA